MSAAPSGSIPDRPDLPALPGTRRHARPASLPPGLPDLTTLFAFMREAELRFGSLRLRIEDRTIVAGGERLTVSDLLLRHPGRARIATSVSGAGGAGYEIWLSDGVEVRTYSAISRVATRRPLRRRPRGLNAPDLPGRTHVYDPLTPLPTESISEAFVHPAGFCQNVLATGRCRVTGTATVAGRGAVVVECDHPRTIEVGADRPDHWIQVAADTEIGLVLRLVEAIGGAVTRHAEATVVEPDAPIPDAAFELSVPPEANRIY